MALNFADLFEHAAEAFAERTAVACGDRQVSYAELDERTNRLAHHLAGIGVGPGDHVGLYARNSIEALETLIAPGGPYACGAQVTLADICLVPQVANARRFKVRLDTFPKIAAVEAACLALPAFERARPENQPDAE